MPAQYLQDAAGHFPAIMSGLSLRSGKSGWRAA